MLSRRVFLSGTASLVAAPALGAALEASLRPQLRPEGLFRRALPSGAELVAEARLGGRVGYAVADAATGEILEVFHPLLALPPASVAKAVTCAYGLDRLGPGFRFRTRIMADGPLADGRLDGDLWLVGSGDPLLDTDTLARMVADLGATGLREVTGRLRLAAGPLPEIFEIDPDQPDHVGYNPAISGLNLNFNRVHFEWARTAGDYTVTMDARSESLRPAVQIARMQVEERAVPVYTYAQVEGRDQWTVARGALGENGARWLPVRRPAAYVAEVFETLARAQGLRFSGVETGGAVPDTARVLVEHISEPLEDILRGMMRWSTNLTAEVVGLLSTQAGGGQPADLASSGAAMSDWLRARSGARQAAFVDHSGLGDRSRIRAHDMVLALVAAGPNGLLRRLMRDIPMLDERGNVIADHPVQVVAKTGTLNFVSSLAGYARTPGGRDLAFGIFCADTDRRATLTEEQRERPDGARPYNARAKRLQQRLIERWAVMYR
ncbi:D-alanyl-D-alanine carboxypeptidase/D-alanyl-D-alanine-endopeptidase [Roseicyclus persicicus]|uniref:D-alanyl-D-alanine carboxypeptidase/D-alanyl-D-alanine-endopeptidase n=1 Tax=Roseicyclus persicicus TaxID=2650661 RepID=A0A7X6GWV2_9RHOB|nr:D-alanyl-D-alanine carboxypeptidase/D-alanyl-D-alanine-endopeptidase [Roseibacterium persicicum]NKX43144.1 D-alanyl-D-alanine carboxypeptidase/D-alanyl-D-alanine-endopeptidase [Roseibacterium persicicum]